MKIFSNFDTKQKKRAFLKHQKDHGEENVLLIEKSKVYWLLFVVLPFLGDIIVASFFLYIAFYLVENQTLKNIIFIFTGLVFIVSMAPVIKKYLEYKMDFLVITPKNLIKYDQEGFFERDIKTLNTMNIKTITIKKNGIIKSICNIGDMTFLSEASSDESADTGRIVFHFVRKPERKRYDIVKIIRKIQ